MTERESTAGRVSEQIEQQEANLQDTLDTIDSEAKTYRDKQRRNGIANTWFRAALAVLGVAAPSLVAYQTQVESRPLLVLLTIGLTALAGAAVNLQAIFSWGERYTRAMLTALNLEELSSDTKSIRQEILGVHDELYQLRELRRLNEDAAKILHSTIRENVQAEAKLVTQSALPAHPPDVDTSKGDVGGTPSAEEMPRARRLRDTGTDSER